MALDPRTPVLVGVSTITRRDGDPGGPDATALMIEATETALADAGAPGLRDRIDQVLVPKGTWKSRDPGRDIAPEARTLVADFGVPQAHLVTLACQRVQDGAGAAIVVSGEAAFRAQRARREGVDAAESAGPEGGPDEYIERADLLTPTEIERQLTVAARQYAVIESSMRHHAGRTVDEHAYHLGDLWARFAAVAADNPDAWDRSAPFAEQIAFPGPDNRMIAAPYTKRLCSQMNVDQASALLVTTVEVASAAGVPRDRWVFPVATATSNLVVPLTLRRDLHRWPTAAEVGKRVFELAETGPDDLDHVDLYSCFPSAVQAQAAEYGIDPDRQLTVTGGMTFAGGPLNGYTYLAMVSTARLLRESGGRALTTSVSGLLTKNAAAVWSSEPPAGGFRTADVSAEAEAATAMRPIEHDLSGPGTIAGYTVTYDGSEPSMAIAVVEVGNVRTVALCHDAAVAAALVAEDAVGTAVDVTAPGEFTR